MTRKIEVRCEGTDFASVHGMIATALSAALIGLDALPVRVEVQAHRGPPQFELVGLCEVAVREARVRVKSALMHVGVDLSEQALVVNLAPADVKKAGAGFDLAIAAATLAAVGAIPERALEDTLFVGELSLSGRIHGLRGLLPQLLGAKSRGLTKAIVPRRNEREAALVEGIDVRSAANLEELVSALRGKSALPRASRAARTTVAPDFVEDLADVRGQAAARRALEIAAAGGHNLLFVGPPGGGKTMLARRLAGIMPELSHAEALEAKAIQSVAGILEGMRDLSYARPFRAPHHTVSEAGLIGGGGESPRPGEVSLAHLGVLFLDELPEFRRGALEALRQPLEDGVVTVSRARVKVSFPARPLLVCAMNPCPCGYLGDAARCGCSRERVRLYRAKISGPLFDRIDAHVVLPPVSLEALADTKPGESSRAVRERVLAARRIQELRRNESETQCSINAALCPGELKRVANIDAEGRSLLEAAFSRLGLSARAYSKILRVARTIADLAGERSIAPAHVGEAIALRSMDRSDPARAA